MNLAFEGVKVVDFGWVHVLPTITKYLADHGAQVVRLESNHRLDNMRTSGIFKNDIPDADHSVQFTLYNSNKYGISLNLKHPKAPEILKRIVAWADIVAEGFRPGVMETLGLGYDNLKSINPDIIMVRASSLGQTGPHSSQPGTGVQLTALSGFSHLTGWPDRTPSSPFEAYTDTIAPMFAGAALIAALDYRRRTGKGQCLDLSEYETAIHFLAPAILDFNVNGRVANRRGNYCSYAAPHGAYPCKGEDRWCVIAVFNDEEWGKLCEKIGHPEWIKHPKFATLLSRKKNENELDRLIAEWTINLSPEDIMAKLQEGGVPSGVVENCKDVYQDPQLKHRRCFQELEHPVMGKYFFERPAFILSKTPATARMPSPCLGEHNYYFYTQILGITDEEFVALLTQGTFE